MRRRVLFAGEDTLCFEGLAQYFASQHYFVLRAMWEDDIVMKAKDNKLDAIIMDIHHLEGGLKLCIRLRKVTDVPIVIIDKKDDAEIRIQALNLGADAFLVKPVNNLEVLARLKALYRRREGYDRDDLGLLRLYGLEFDFQMSTIRVQERAVKLTKKEMAVLRHLAVNLDKVLTRDYLIHQVWGFWDVSDTRTVDTHIKKVRRILASLNASWEIVTVPRVGYRLSRKEHRPSICSA